MMKMQMRPQKTQISLPTSITYTAAATFDRTMYSIFGYARYEALLIGGSGGKSANAHSKQPSGAPNVEVFAYGSGGGGGGVLHLQGDLASLAVQTAVVVGAAGDDSTANAGDNVKAGNGTDGGTTTFNAKSAYGGKGATGGKCTINTDTGSNPWKVNITASQGGAGGGNSENLGSGGVGGSTGSCVDGQFVAFTGNGSLTNVTDPVNPTAGTGVAGTGSVLSGSHGGGGGQGRLIAGNAGLDDPANGATSSTGFDGAPGRTAETDQGGSGGGGDEFALTGSHTYWGSNDGSGHGAGRVFLKVS